ncbi:DUF2786 domain-containing protein [Dactylosporangium sp. CA-233914]|uniref:DUF2786 domain-containing protein n=1 Tax=Dactylosporangium sp. CA-233914 TaxID=3239934 RepID=UPI003D8BB802
MKRQIDALVRGAVAYEDGLDRLAVAPAAQVDPALFAALNEAAARLFGGGWQPVELHRAVVRRGGTDRPLLGRAVIDAVAAHLRDFPRRGVDERWLAQAGELDATVWWSADERYVTELAAKHRRDRISAIDDLLELLTVLVHLPKIEVLVPPPGTAPRRSRKSTVDERLLERVRALLAKAESTGYPAEAETYTAKAQELIARHAIDEALLAGLDSAAELVPFARRIGVDHPYEGEKASLLSAVAEANRCHTVWSPDYGFTTVFGFDADIDAVDLLYTSLLVQAGRAMAKAEPPGGKAGRARLKAFRQSFLVAYAVRIGERLARASELALAEAPQRSDLLPVLRSRDEQVRETMARVFPRTVRGRGSRVDSREGWESGRDAADRATLL